MQFIQITNNKEIDMTSLILKQIQARSHAMKSYK